MRFEIIEIPQKKFFVINAEGNFTIEDNIQMIRDLALHKSWKKGLNVLLDHRKTVFKNINIGRLKEIITTIALLEKEYGASNCAIISPIEGMSIIAMYKFESEFKVNMKTKIFCPLELSEAYKWIEAISIAT